MIDHVWTVVCSQAVIDRDTNNVSLHNVAEQITIQDRPDPDASALIPLEVVTLWARSDLSIPSRGQGRFTFVSPSGKTKVGPTLFDIDLSEYRRYRTRTRLRVLPVGEPGRYIFRVDYKDENGQRWRKVAAVPLEVTFESPEESEQAPDEAK